MSSILILGSENCAYAAALKTLCEVACSADAGSSPGELAAVDEPSDASLRFGRVHLVDRTSLPQRAHAEPDNRLLLVYTSPAFAISRWLQTTDPAPEEIGRSLSRWIDEQLSLLEIFHRSDSGAILVNGLGALIQWPRLLELVGFTHAVLRTKVEAQPGWQQLGRNIIEERLAEPFLLGCRDAQALYLEMESLSHLPGDADEVIRLAAILARSDYLEQRSELRSIRIAQVHLVEGEQQMARLAERSAIEAEALRVQVSNLQEFKETLEMANQDILASSEAQGVRMAEVLKEAEALRDENEILLGQLQQLQIELDRRSGPAAPGVDGAVFAAPPEPVTVDLRGEIDGDNWYYAEQDGRWAGPTSVSTLRVPAMPEGRYELQLDVVDAMHKRVLAGMTVAVNGVPLGLKRVGRGVAAIVTARFFSGDFEARPKWEFQFRFKELMSPAQRGSADKRMLAVRIRSLTLSPILQGVK